MVAVGTSDDAMARLFQPFFRDEVRANQQGLGLGLHIASEIARAHGGQINRQLDRSGNALHVRDAPNLGQHNRGGAGMARGADL